MPLAFSQYLFDLRRLLKDRRGPDFVFPTTQVEEYTNNAIVELADEMGIGEVYTPGWLAIVAGTDEYTVTLPSGTAGIENLQQLVEDNLKWPLRPLTKDQMIARKVGSVGSTRRGHPVTGYYLYETDQGVLRIQLDPIPTQDDSLNATWTYQHPKVGLVDPTSGGTVTTTLLFANKGCTALKLRVAAECVKNASDEDLARLKLNRQAGQEWEAESQSIALDEYWRITRGNRSGNVQRMR